MSDLNRPAAASAILDDASAMRAIDKSDIMRLTVAFADQCRRGAQIGAEFVEGTRPVRGPVANLVVTGLGGSAIGGDLLRCVGDARGNVPVVVNRDYDLPAFVDRQTLVVVASYSGNTEETLQAYADARRRDAQVVCITSGGTLHERAVADGVPTCIIPGGQPPRTATGYMFFPMLAVAVAAGVIDGPTAPSVNEAIAVMERLAGRYGPDVPIDRNPAKQLARGLHRRIPVIYGSQGYRGAVAVRWKGQFNENAKQAAFANVFPEQNHNEILAWVQSGKQAPRWSVVYLRDPEERESSHRIGRRIEVTRQIIGGAAEQHEAWAEGKSLLARMFSLFTLGDFTTVYSAFLNGVDPTDIGSIDQLKAELAAA